MNRSAWSVMTLLVGLAGCASTATTPGAPGKGWRLGTVARVGDARDFGDATTNDCRPPVGRFDGEGRYASVTYFSGRHAHLRIVPLPDTFDIAVGDPVYVRLAGCDDALSH